MNCERWRRVQTIIGLLSLFLPLEWAAGQGAGRTPEDRSIRIGEKFRIQSRVLNEERSYWVYVPSSYDNKHFEPKKYPVLYLLDGDAHFQSASGVVQFMSENINGNIQIPELIIVAIPNTQRTR